MRGDWQDFEILPDGTRRLIAEGRNLVVNTAYVAMAMAMKQNPAYGGFLYWAVGDGGATATTAAWDAGVIAGTIAPAKTNTKLVREVFRKAISPANIVFLNAVGAVSATPTNRLQITIIFDENEPSGSGPTDLREWGVFGGDATAAANSGRLINRKVHKTYTKSTVSKLERVLRFTF